MKLIILFNAISAASFPISKYLIGVMPPFLLTAVRQLLSGIALLVYQYFMKPHTLYIKRKDWGSLVAIGLWLMCLSLVPIYYSLDYITTARSSFIFNLTPFITAFLSYLYFKETLTIKKTLGLFIAIVGFLPLLLTESPGESSKNGMLWIFSYGELFAIGGVFAWAYGWVLVRKLVSCKRYSPIAIMGYTMVIGSFFSFIGAGIFESYRVSYTHGYVALILFILFMGGNAIGYSLYSYLLQQYTATFLSFAAFMMPMFAALFGWICLHEPITIYLVVSTILVFVGLYLFYQEELRQGYVVRD
ncbi:DMT family transporter [Candidatus Babeliales bacterium]|nr:DMT family transporter [Candidatus Babeliales bacterium]